MAGVGVRSLCLICITLNTYSHAIPAMQEEAAALIARLVFATKWLRPVQEPEM